LLIDASPAVKKALSKAKHRLVFVTYPEPEGRNVFWQAILFHELGHAIDWNKDITKNILEEIEWKRPTSIDPTILGNWIQEIVADLIAIRLVGPAMLFSSRCAGLTADVLDSDSITHPAFRWRFAWMLEHLKRLGYMDLKGFKMPGLLVTWSQYLERNRGGLPLKSKFRSVRALLNRPDVRKKIHEALSSIPVVMDAKAFAKQIPSIVEKFRDQLPHCGDATEIIVHTAAVFNGIWETSLEKDADEAMDREYRDILCGLALKSIEGKYIQNLWGYEKRDF